MGHGEEEEAVARREFHAGQAAFDAGRHSTALEHFHAAYAHAPYPELLFDIGRCLEEMGRLNEAIETYRRFLAVAPRGQRDELRARIVRLESTRAAALTAGDAGRGPSKPRSVGLGVVLGLSFGGLAFVSLGLGLGLGLGLRAQSTRLPALEFAP